MSGAPIAPLSRATRLRLLGVGLRPRLVVALVLTSAVTLAAAALTLLGPLESRLRRDATSSLLAAGLGARPEIQDAAFHSGTLNVSEIASVARSLGRRNGARVAVVDGSGRRVFDTDTEVPDPFDDALAAARSGHSSHDVRFGRLRVALPFRVHGKPYVLVLRKTLGFVRSANRVVSDAFLKAAAVGLAIALILGIGLARTLLLRLEALRDATREMETRGLDAEPHVDNSLDEIGELARAFASMQVRLRRQEAARRAFVATASHELRTPLASLDGMLELLADDLSEPLDLEDARNRLGQSQEQSRRLGHLASDLLDLSRIDAAVELRSEPVELTELSRAVVAEFERRASERDVRLDFRGPGGAAWAVGDPGSLARVVRILIDNALRVSPQGEAVEIEVAAGADFVTVSIADAGPGVPEPERELIFERFQRGAAATGEGFGLGLAIGRELAGRMNGTLTLQPSPRGARFTLAVPADDTAAPRAGDGATPAMPASHAAATDPA